MEQIGEFYYRNQEMGCGFCMAIIENVISNVTNNLMPPEWNYIIYIDNTTIFNHSETPIEESIFIIPSRVIVHGIYNETDLYGPYVAEVLSWG